MANDKKVDPDALRPSDFDGPNASMEPAIVAAIAAYRKAHKDTSLADAFDALREKAERDVDAAGFATLAELRDFEKITAAGDTPAATLSARVANAARRHAQTMRRDGDRPMSLVRAIDHLRGQLEAEVAAKEAERNRIQSERREQQRLLRKVLREDPATRLMIELNVHFAALRSAAIHGPKNAAREDFGGYDDTYNLLRRRLNFTGVKDLAVSLLPGTFGDLFGLAVNESGTGRESDRRLADVYEIGTLDLANPPAVAQSRGRKAAGETSDV